jgi:hypothetical protein
MARVGEEIHVDRVLVGKPKNKILFGRPKRKREDNIKRDHQEVGWRHGVN